MQDLLVLFCIILLVVSSTPGGATPISGMSSLASLLATPLSSLGPAHVGRAVPLVLSSALPPVPARAVDKIRSGLFIDFKELLLDNVALLQRLAETSSLLSGAPPTHMSEVTDILTWISCFLYFVAARSEDSATRDLMPHCSPSGLQAWRAGLAAIRYSLPPTDGSGLSVGVDRSQRIYDGVHGAVSS